MTWSPSQQLCLSECNRPVGSVYMGCLQFNSHTLTMEEGLRQYYAEQWKLACRMCLIVLRDTITYGVLRGVYVGTWGIHDLSSTLNTVSNFWRGIYHVNWCFAQSL